MDLQLSETILQIEHLPNKILNEFLGTFKLSKLSKEHYLLRTGTVCKDLWLIQKGLARHFYMDEKGKERNTWFTPDVNFTTDIPSLLFGKPAQESIQLLEDSTVYSISFDAIKELRIKHHSISLWYIKLLESKYFPQVEQRLDELQFLSATERYHNLISKEPTFSQRISLGNIASYLNISQETLSRIRNNRE